MPEHKGARWALVFTCFGLAVVAAFIARGRVFDRQVEWMVLESSRLAEAHPILSEANAWLSSSLQAEDEDASRNDRREFLRTDAGTPFREAMQQSSPLLLQGALASRTVDRTSIRFGNIEAELIDTVACVGRVSGCDATKRNLSDASLLNNVDRFREAAGHLAAACDSLPSDSRPAFSLTCDGSEIEAAARRVVKAATRNKALASQTLVVAGSAGDIEKPLLDLVFIDRFEAGLCNTAPYDGRFIVRLESAPMAMREVRVDAGSCELVSLGHHQERPTVFVGFAPDRGDPAFREIETLANFEASWKLLTNIRPAEGDRRWTCAAMADLSAAPLAGCAQHDSFELGSLGDAWASVPTSPSTLRAVRRTFWEAYDPQLTALIPESVIDDPEGRARHVTALAGTLRDRAKDPSDTRPGILLGVSVCSETPFAELQIGIEICGLSDTLPHGFRPRLYQGDVVTHLAGVPIFSTSDIHRVLRRIDQNTPRFDAVATPLEITVGGETRVALPFWNPAVFRGCPIEWPGTFAFFNTVLLGGPAKLTPSGYGKMLMIRQFCPDAALFGELSGMVVGVTGRAAKFGAQTLLKRQASKSVLRFLASRNGIIVMQGLDEVTYAFVSAPPLQTWRETLAGAKEDALFGMAIGVVATSRMRLP
ncbi:hypothetical protein [Salipiger sp. PrR007]|uniref:hypothetical protein n=1 Tax=Salipiger sp. PrR007 TaxID=2706884 RepID=UPI0013BAD266|nr:hypothetical protein [Salipiger sp. PrR007]NDW34632.1 hypothetical protein [Salipiger sp. PrR007]